MITPEIAVALSLIAVMVVTGWIVIHFTER